ncbi:cupin domain-containing protein [Aestuariibacter sp. A3R04]|uniref:cupin domain-containing protein n=1 Tax=Aestuariibacter sp. A3R04 TaxID=2841571 RepID=UPI001C099969|nr:cupin domain-containing protein [Aestuariibacter sp. A3R04]MBU3020566.1 cupin domain-containing protein [Aestuariibacter sp. A3R04]
MSKHSEIFLSGDTTKIEDIGGGLKRQMLGYNHELMAVKIWFDKGAEGYTHAHRHSQVSYVIEGEFHFTINGETKVMKPGDSCYIPPHAEHGAICPTGGILIDTFSPAREDFIKDEL